MQEHFDMGQSNHAAWKACIPWPMIAELAIKHLLAGASFLIVQPEDAYLWLLIVSSMSWLWESCNASNEEASSVSMVIWWPCWTALSSRFCATIKLDQGVHLIMMFAICDVWEGPWFALHGQQGACEACLLPSVVQATLKHRKVATCNNALPRRPSTLCHCSTTRARKPNLHGLPLLP